MLPFNTSSFSNTLGATDLPVQRKALVAPFKEEFDRKPDDILQHIANFTHQSEEAGVIKDFQFMDEEHEPQSNIDMSDWTAAASWLTDPIRFTYGNILIDPSKATLNKFKQARDATRSTLKKFSVH